MSINSILCNTSILTAPPTKELHLFLNPPPALPSKRMKEAFWIIHYFTREGLYYHNVRVSASAKMYKEIYGFSLNHTPPYYVSPFDLRI